ncbi:MAG: hypothetical protein ACYS0I_14450 [Planctomycetota bacterium]|jgi:hypothetical protein
MKIITKTMKIIAVILNCGLLAFTGWRLMEKGLPDTEKPFAIMAVSLLVLCPAVNLIVLFSHQEGGKKKTEALNNVVRETNQKQ